MFKDKILLITGGTGSFGNVVLDRILQEEIKEIRIFSRDEKKQNDMRLQYKNEKLKFYIGDVRDPESIRTAMKGVDFVFHAAALKQVPSCEFYPLEAVKTNILGTENVLNAAIDACVKKVVCLSTDKAAYPINAMGTSKAMMEKIILAKSRTIPETETMICCTRYGNVMASRGSVIPLFVEQGKKGELLTITNPNMTRYLMNLKEAVNLVLYAFEHAHSGDIIVQKSPASTISDLATAIKELFKFDNEVQIVGDRHGEKLHEVLLTKEEFFFAKDMGQYYIVPLDTRNLNYSQNPTMHQKILFTEEYNSYNTTRLDVEGIKKILLSVDYIKQELENHNK